MLEVINGFLILYFTILCTLSALMSYLVKPIASCFSKPTKDERNMWSELKALKDQQSQISMKDEFSAYSKIQRKINKLENQLKDNSQNRASKRLAIKGSIHLGLQAVIGLVVIVSVIWFRREPLVVLKGDLFPLTTILRYPSEMPNAISTHVWVLISNYSIRCLIKPFTSN